MSMRPMRSLVALSPCLRKDGRSVGSLARRPGVVLFSVLVIIAILTLVGYQFFNLMQAEFAAAIASNKVLQSRHLAESGLDFMTFTLTRPETAGLSPDGTSPVVFAPYAYDDIDTFHFRPVTGAGGVRGYFSVVSPRDPSDPLATTEGYRFGVEDEGGKINLHTLVLTDRDNQAKSILARLPGMDEEKADALLKWIKPADGTDSLTYSSMGYAPKNGAAESLEELLLVRTITPRLLLGNDRNRNGRLEPDEDDTNGVLDPGLARYITVHSRELDVDMLGQPRIPINDRTDAQTVRAMHTQLAEVLPPDLYQEILKFQVFGPPPRRGGQGGGGGGGGGGGRGGGRQQQGTTLPAWATLKEGKLEINYDHEEFNPQQLRTVTSLFDLVVEPNSSSWTVRPASQGGQGGGGGGQNQPATQIPCLLRTDNKEVLREMLPVLLDKLTTRNIAQYGLERPARININSAPEEVLSAYITTDAEMQKVMAVRPSPETDPSLAPVYGSLAWLLTEADLAKDNLLQLERTFTARSQVYRFQVVGYYEVNGPATRLEAVVDINGGRPRLLYWRDISNLGRGFDFSQYVPQSP